MGINNISAWTQSEIKIIIWESQKLYFMLFSLHTLGTNMLQLFVRCMRCMRAEAHMDVMTPSSRFMVSRWTLTLN